MYFRTLITLSLFVFSLSSFAQKSLKKATRKAKCPIITGEYNQCEAVSLDIDAKVLAEGIYSEALEEINLFWESDELQAVAKKYELTKENYVSANLLMNFGKYGNDELSDEAFGEIAKTESKQTLTSYFKEITEKEFYPKLKMEVQNGEYNSIWSTQLENGKINYSVDHTAVPESSYIVGEKTGDFKVSCNERKVNFVRKDAEATELVQFYLKNRSKVLVSKLSLTLAGTNAPFTIVVECTK
ncbi:hypothetical protein N9N67_02985 [Bacteriovoracaceae bacterium]|nr:hypothetical protein [Bacteriovoracaceae bacterium]